MGQNGVDLLLSPAAFKLLPISPEIKRRKTLKTLYDWYEQAEKHEGNPVVFFRGDRKKWLVMLDLEYFLELLKGVKSTKTKTYRIKPQG